MFFYWCKQSKLQLFHPSNLKSNYSHFPILFGKAHTPKHQLTMQCHLPTTRYRRKGQRPQRWCRTQLACHPPCRSDATLAAALMKIHVTSFLSISCLSNSVFTSIRLYNNNIYKIKHCLTHVKDFYWEP